MAAEVKSTEFSGQVALIVGGAGGLGRESARLLASRGSHVVIADINESALLATAGDLADAGSVSTAVLDVTDTGAVESAVQSVVADHGRLDILVTSQGFPQDGRLTDMTDEQWHNVVNVCLTGTFNCIRAAARPMIKQEYGRIITFASRAWHGNPGQANYSAAKAGVVGLTRSVAKELGRYSITANAIAPGLIDTESLRQLPTYDSIAERAVKANSIRRLGLPEDVAAMVGYLASPAAGFLTGEVVHVSGGRFS
ncbi:SDR family oxidoreductase [Dactylosporangium fulvum]|uniref:SDR family oxidoreductase n=1 Tax=Dactylosporangium fulvum TaxID=53359 RepID=A0ABY5VRJ4_9ACTN|nr:SDR family NAD(P)-dependent oxidoreductase [Dactylosporangium fulvum]UWP79764.1 SDR family oxidoreductase [Dactylosporangium fulvum]